MVCCSNSTYFCIGIVVVGFLIFRHYRQRIFAWFMSYVTENGNPFVDHNVFDTLKKDWLKPLMDTVSQNPQLRKANAIKLLEVGVGSGANFKFYPDGTRLVVVDPNPHFTSYYNKNRSKFPKIQSEIIIETTGDKMDMIESDSIDAVVMSSVMCSVTDLQGLLKEIKRVMVPGGKLYFMEHCKDPSNTIMITMQDFLSNSGIWPYMFCGCMVNKEFSSDLDKAGFASVEKSRVKLPISVPVLRPGIMGVAVK